MTPTPIQAFVSQRFPADAVAEQLQGDQGWRVLNAVRAEDETRFFEQTVPALATRNLGNGNSGWSLLAWPKFEGVVGHVQERACDHLSAHDIAAIAGLLAEPTAEDIVSLVRAVELADEEAIAHLSRRLADVPTNAFPTELYSTPLGAARIYQAIRARFDDIESEIAFLLTRSGTRLIIAGGCAIAEAHGTPWPEAIPTHNRCGTNAVRALSFGAYVAGATDQLKAILSWSMAKGRVETAGLPWDERYFGAGGGQAVNVNRCGCIVVSLAGKAHPQLEALPNRPRCSVKVHKKEEKAIADFNKRIEQLTAKHGLTPVDPSTLGPALKRSAGSVPSDFTLALMAMGAPWPEERVELFRGGPEEARRALAAGISPEEIVWYDGKTPYLENIGQSYWDIQRVEVVVAAGGRTSSPDRARQAAETGELQLLKVLLEAGAPKPENSEKTAQWPRIDGFLRSD